MATPHVSWIVPKGFSAITLWPFGIYLSSVKYLSDSKIVNREKIHWEQQKELAGIFFYLLYTIEWCWKTGIYGKNACRNLSSEREVSLNEKNNSYLYDRKRYRWLKYIFANAT